MGALRSSQVATRIALHRKRRLAHIAEILRAPKVGRRRMPVRRVEDLAGAHGREDVQHSRSGRKASDFSQSDPVDRSNGGFIQSPFAKLCAWLLGGFRPLKGKASGNADLARTGLDGGLRQTLEVAERRAFRTAVLSFGHVPIYPESQRIVNKSTSTDAPGKSASVRPFQVVLLSRANAHMCGHMVSHRTLTRLRP